MRIKELKSQIKKNGFTYTLVRRTTDKFLYKQEDDKGKLVGYEVFKNRLSKPHPKSLNDCNEFDMVETFPGNEEFGYRAWTYTFLHEALKRYESI